MEIQPDAIYIVLCHFAKEGNTTNLLNLIENVPSLLDWLEAKTIDEIKPIAIEHYAGNTNNEDELKWRRHLLEIIRTYQKHI